MNDKVKQMTREILQPFFDEIVETSCRIFSSVYDNLPKDMPIEEKDKIVKSVLEKQRDIMVASMESNLPEDFDKRLKEAYYGGKRF